MTKLLAAILIVTLGFGLAARRDAEEPQVTYYYGSSGPYTTGVYDNPAWYQVPGDK